MLDTGAIFIYDNIAAEADAFSVEGVWTDQHNVLEPQLHPYAIVEGAGAIILEFEDTQTINAVALLGVDGDGLRTLGIEDWNSVTEEWQSIAFDAIRSQATPFSPSHVVMLCRTWFHTRKMRISFNAPNDVNQIGSVFVGRFLQNDQLADSDWSVVPLQQSATDVSEGGQVYGHGTRPRRQLRLTNGTMDSTTLFGHFRELEEIQLPQPSLTGWTEPEPGVFELQGGSSGEVLWEDVLTLGNSSQEAYLIRYDYYGFDLTSSDQFFPEIEVRAVGTSLLRFNPVSQGRGWAVAGVSPDRPDLRIDGDLGSYSSSVKIQFQIQSLHLVAAPRPAATTPDVAVDLGLSLHAVMAHSGKAKPIIAILRTADPVWIGPTTIYGYVDAWQPYGHRGGNHFGGGLSITETF